MLYLLILSNLAINTIFVFANPELIKFIPDNCSEWRRFRTSSLRDKIIILDFYFLELIKFLREKRVSYTV